MSIQVTSRARICARAAWVVWVTHLACTGSIGSASHEEGPRTRDDGGPQGDAEGDGTAPSDGESPGDPAGDPAMPLVHPRMYFYADEVAQIRTLAASTHADIVGRIVTKADSLLAEPIPSYPTSSTYSELNAAAAALEVMAFAHVLTGNQSYLDRAKSYLFAYAAWPAWGWDAEEGDRDLTLSTMIMANALAFDWLYNDLSTVERDTVRAALAEHTHEMYEASTTYNADWRNWWLESYAQNHWTHDNAGLGVGALVLEGEDDRASMWLQQAIDQYGIDTACLEQIGDGTWHEGLTYQNGKLVLALPFVHNLLRLKGVDWFADTYLRNFIEWRIYNYRPGSNHGVMPFSSYVPAWGGWNVNEGHVMLRALANRFRDGRAEWLSQRILEEWGRSTWRAHYYISEFFVYDPTVQPQVPTSLPLTRHFPDLGAVIWRTGFGVTDLTFALKSGPYGGDFFHRAFSNGVYPFDRSGPAVNVGHNHEDAGTFYIYRGGLDLASEMADRHGDYGVMPTVGQTAHNTLMVDGRGQYWPPRHQLFAVPDASLEVVESTPSFDFVLANPTGRYREWGATSPYPPEGLIIDEFRRYVSFVRPDYFVMVDRVRAASEHEYEWVCHFNDNATVSLEGNWIKGDANGTEILGVYVAKPASFVTSQGTSAYVNSSEDKPYIRVRPETDVANTTFAMVLLPTNATSWPSRPSVSVLSGDEAEGTGVQVELDGTQVHLVHYGSASQVTLGTTVLQGVAASILRDGSGALTKIFMVDGQLLAEDGGSTELLSASTDTTVEADYMGSALALWGENLSGLRAYGPAVDLAHVTVNGQTVSATREGDSVVVP